MSLSSFFGRTPKYTRYGPLANGGAKGGGFFDFGFFTPFLAWLGLPAAFFTLAVLMGFFNFTTTVITRLENMDGVEEDA